MAQRKALGAKVGPTGRKRDEFNVFAKGRDGKELDKPHAGRTGYEAYGQTGVREAKHKFHAKFPRRWKKFSVYNHSRLTRQADKRREVTKGGKKFKLSYTVFHPSYSKSNWYYEIYAEAGGKKQKIRAGNTPYKTKTEATAQAEKAIAALR